MNLEIHYDDGGEWAALYVDGQLDPTAVGDSYHARARALELCGVKEVDNSAFLRGGSHREDAARTLDEVEAYRRVRDEKKANAARLRAQAAELIEQAKRLDGSR